MPQQLMNAGHAKDTTRSEPSSDEGGEQPNARSPLPRAFCLPLLVLVHQPRSYTILHGSLAAANGQLQVAPQKLGTVEGAQKDSRIKYEDEAKRLPSMVAIGNQSNFTKGKSGMKYSVYAGLSGRASDFFKYYGRRKLETQGIR